MKSIRAYSSFIQEQILQHCWKQEVTLCYAPEFGCASVTWGWERCQWSWGHHHAQLSYTKPQDHTQISTKVSVGETHTHTPCCHNLRCSHRCGSRRAANPPGPRRISSAFAPPPQQSSGSWRLEWQGNMVYARTDTKSLIRHFAEGFYAADW